MFWVEVLTMNPRSEKDCDHLRMPQSVPRGLLRFAILRMMMDNEMSGADVMQSLSERSGGEWSPSPGSIYPLLGSLEDEGFIVEVRTEGRSRIYRASDEGAKKLQTMLDKIIDVEERVRIGRIIWSILIDLDDRLDHHIRAIHAALDLLFEEIPDLKTDKKYYLLEEFEEISERIEQIHTQLEEK
ncbi:MAG: hypothetical protein GF411_13175 [Candidatus Lokiarchaeota archaeon]|nr:hypothetical protein [Candidatus Lokiarchaeota archaeon]